jgi:ATP phosphoribosyltransferase
MTPLSQPLRLALPKGRMQEAVHDLLADAGIRLTAGERAYRPELGHPELDAKILKPQNIVEMLQAGSREIGFTGADWVSEMGAELVELLDTGLDPVRVVLAAPPELLVDGRLPDRPLVIATELVQVTRRWAAGRGLQARVVRSYGATEVFPPEDADAIVDISATGATLRAHGLHVVEEILSSSTRLFAAASVLADPERRAAADRLVMLLRSALEARRRVMVEVNVAPDRLEAVVGILPCMREATVAPLHGSAGYAVRAAVPRDTLPGLIPEIKEQGGTDVVVTRLAQIVP